MEDDAGNHGKPSEAPPNTEPVQQPEPAADPQADSLKRQYDELHDRYLRLAADFENFRKRTVRDQERIVKQASEQLAYDVLEVVDNIERAARYDDTHLREGLIQIQNLLAGILGRHGITPVESLGKAFDPAEHEAIAHVPSEKEPGMVIEEVSRGYRMHDKVIRFAKVAVSKGNEKTTNTEE